MTDEDRFTADDLRDYHLEHGSDERLVCPNCLFSYQDKAITDEFDLNFRGFSKEISPDMDGGFVLAKYGICPCIPSDVDEGSINIYGTPLILESEYQYEQKLSDDGTEIDNKEITLPPLEIKNAFKSRMTTAIGDHFISQLEPPYKVAKYKSSVVFDTGGEEVKFEKVDNINTKNEWFEILYPYLWDMKNLQSDNVSLKFHIIPTIYLHKTIEMNHIEPIWVFMRRFGMNLRAVKLSIKNYPSNLPQHVQKLVSKLKLYDVSRSTIESFTYMLKRNELIGDLDNKKLNKIIDKATEVLANMKKVEYKPGQSIFEFINEEEIVSNILSINGNPLPPIGIIEGFCIFAALQESDPKIAQDFFTRMYPKEQASIWQWSLTKLGQSFGNIDQMKSLIEMM